MMPSSKTVKLPKRSFEEELETIARKNLLDVFDLDRFEIRDVFIRDRGVDARVELKSPDHHVGTEFQIQLKAKFKGKGKAYYSKSIGTHNIEYLLNNAQSSLYIFYVKEEDTFYYEWANEFASSLARKMPEWEKKDSHTLRFHKKLTKTTAGEIYKRVFDEAAATRRERDFEIYGEVPPITNSIHDRKFKTILSDFKLLFKAFSGLSVLPMHAIEQLPPFAPSKNSQAYYSESGSTLHTDNQDLLKMFESLGKKGNKVVILPDSELKDDPLGDEKGLLRSILIFFSKNKIHHVSSHPKKGSDKRICVHELYVYGNCTCERCTYNRGDLAGAIEKLRNVTPKSEIERLRNAYVYMELGEFSKGYELYRELIRHFHKNESYVSYFMCKFTLSRTYFLYRHHYFASDRSQVLGYLRQINLDDEIQLLERRKLVKDEVILVLRWISQNSFMHHAHRQIDEKLQEVRVAYVDDKLGGWTSADLSNPFYYGLRAPIDFVEDNLIASSAAYGYSSYLHKMFEGLLATYNLYNENFKHFPGFDDDILRSIILHGSAKEIEELLKKYRTELIPFYASNSEERNDANTRASFMSLLNRLINSLPTVNSTVKFGDKEMNHFLSRRVNEWIKNLCILVSILDLACEELNQIFEKLIRSFKELAFLQQTTAHYLSHIISRRFDMLEPALLEEFYFLSISQGKFDNVEIRTSFLQLAKQNNVLKFNDRIERHVLANITNNEGQLELRDFIYFSPFASTKGRQIILDHLIAALERKFDFEVYYYAAIRDVVPYQTFLEKSIEYVPLSDREKENQAYFGFARRNRRVKLFVDLAFKFKLDLTSPSYQKIAIDDLYFQWLFNLDTFDYSQFNPFWLLEFHSDHYFNEFKKFPRIVDATKKIVLEKKVDLLTEIYLKFFV